MSGGRWRVAGVGDVQVDSALRQERMWGAVVTEKYEKKRNATEGGTVGRRKEQEISRKC